MPGETGLSEGARDALELVERLNAEAAVSALRETDLPADPLYAVCLWLPEDPMRLDAYLISAATEADRRELLASRSPYRAFHAIWNPMEHAVEEIDCRDLRSCARFVEAVGVLASELKGRGVLDPARWALNRVARRLARSDLPVPVTPDFVAFVLDDQFSEDLLESLWFAAPPEGAESLRQQSLLPADLKELKGLAVASGEEGWL